MKTENEVLEWFEALTAAGGEVWHFQRKMLLVYDGNKEHIPNPANLTDDDKRQLGHMILPTSSASYPPMWERVERLRIGG